MKSYWNAESERKGLPKCHVQRTLKKEKRPKEKIGKGKNKGKNEGKGER